VEPRPTTIAELLAHHDGVLLDAFGVLVDGSGALPGAPALIAALERRGTPYAVVSNDASRSRETFARQFASFGMAISPERFVTSGSLLPDYLRDRGLVGARTCVLGPEDSHDYVRAGGGVPIVPHEGMELDVVAVCDDAGFPFLDGMEQALSAIVRAVEAGRSVALVVPNPDLIYPKSAGELGFTAGAMARLLELGLERRLPHAGLAFDRLGKPEPHLFTTAARRLGIAIDRLVMIGDQLETDIIGAAAAGMASALIAGVSRWSPGTAGAAPTYLLATLDNPGSAGARSDAQRRGESIKP
jgi:HAD superfamily hydrolase (TIGR01450 family)